MKHLLLRCLLLFSSLPLTAQVHSLPDPFELWQHPFEWPNSNRSVSVRNEFPKLLIDTFHCASHRTEPPYDVVNTLSQSFLYNAQEQQIRLIERSEYLPFFQSLKRTDYTYDNNGREIASLTQQETGPGNFQNYNKTETTYSPDNSSEAVTYRWQNPIWVFQNKTYSEYDAQGRVPYLLSLFWNGNIWENSNRVYRQWHSSGGLAFSKSDIWDGVEWYTVYQADYTFDANDRLVQTIQSQQESAQAPLEPTAQVLMTYDAEGRLDSTLYFTWDASLDAWLPTTLEVNIYNLQDELTEKQSFQYLQGQYVLQRRHQFTYGPMVYSAAAERQLVQVWEPSSGLFLDSEKDENAYTDQPNNIVTQVYNGFKQYPAGVGLWTPSWACNYRFHKSTLSATEQAPASTVCSAPNPYPIGYQVQCPGLIDTRDYMLWVYTLDGRVAYARHFKGAAGWSIGQALPAGMYVVAIQGNGQVLQTQRVVVE